MLNWKRLLGIEKHSPFVQEYFDNSNARSGSYLATVVILLELWMIASLVIDLLTGSKIRSPVWIAQHLTAYLLLLSSAIVMLTYNILYIRGRNPSAITGRIIQYFFAIVCLGFGIFIAYLDYAKSEQVLAFVTMEVFVMGLLVWRPLVSFVMIFFSFEIFYFLTLTQVPHSYATNVNLTTFFIALFMMSLSLYNRKRTEAEKDESLQRMNDYLKKRSVLDDLVDIPNMHYFRSKAVAFLLDETVDINEILFLFIDIENFKSYNEKHGYWEGNEFLKKVAAVIRDVFSLSLVARFSDDHFVVLCSSEGVKEKLESLQKQIEELDSNIQLPLKVGAYRPRNRDLGPRTACDYARFACESIKKKYGVNFCEYTDEMDLEFHRKQYIINNIDSAISRGYIKVFYQPVVWSDSKKLCGLEALARWDDPEYGLLPPAAFISVLEEHRQIHKLDLYVLEKVCSHLGSAEEKGLPCIPVSVNFSRTDFEMIDIASAVAEFTEKYGVDKEYIHVEITESALTENDTVLQNAMSHIREAGYSIWLDDFGSGYSALNVLKDYHFDTMKIDMKFLANFSQNEKTRPILKSIMQMAKELGMQTVTEGVETEEASEFLKSIGCERLQGYLFGKPMPAEILDARLRDGTYTY